MKTYTKTINTFTIQELQGDSQDKAINTVVEHMADEFYEQDVVELYGTLGFFAYDLGIELTDYRVDLYNPSYTYANFDLNQLSDTSNQFKNDMVSKINERMDDCYYDKCYLTGVMYDSLIHDYFASNYPNGITYNDLFKVLREVGTYVLATATDHYTDVLGDESEVMAYATEQRQYEFLEDGSVYTINN